MALSLPFYYYSAIPLSDKTRAAWAAAGTVRVKDPSEVSGDAILLNLGSLSLSYWGRLYNPPEVVRMLNTPGAIRNSPLADLLPSKPSLGQRYWMKGPGRAGKNKSLHTFYSGEKPLDSSWDVQRNVKGQEYRVITVGDAIVSVHLKHVSADKSRVYSHVRRSLCPSQVIDIARKAANRLPSQKTVIGWDIILSSKAAYIIEGNTCPGVNEFSAKGIVEAIRQQ